MKPIRFSHSILFFIIVILHAIAIWFVLRHTGDAIIPPTPIEISLMSATQAPSSQKTHEKSVSKPEPAKPKINPVPTKPTPQIIEPGIGKPIANGATTQTPASASPTTSINTSSSNTSNNNGAAENVVTRNAAYLHNPQPTYPDDVNTSGSLILRVHVTAKGTVDNVDFERRSGSPSLDNAAKTAVLLWRFTPAMQGDTAVATWVRVPIDFKLKKKNRTN